MDLSALDRNSVIPLYYQIRQDLLAQIRAGALKAGQPVPSEQMLSERLGVSRMTARQALKSLCSMGFTYSQRGKGTFVSQVKVERNFRQVLSFTKEMEVRGSRARSKVLSFQLVAANEEVAEALLLAPKEKIIRLKRVRFADSVPLGVECASLPARLCPGLLEKFDPRKSLYEALAELYGIQFTCADEVVEAGLAKSEEAALLKISKGSPVFLFIRTCYIATGQPVEYVKSTYRGDRYNLTNRLTRQNGTNFGEGDI